MSFANWSKSLLSKTISVLTLILSENARSSKPSSFDVSNEERAPNEEASSVERRSVLGNEPSSLPNMMRSWYGLSQAFDLFAPIVSQYVVRRT